MAIDDLGTQNMFKDFSQSTSEMGTGIKSFNMSVGTWVASIDLFKRTIDPEKLRGFFDKIGFSDLDLSLKGLFKKGIRFIGIKSLVDSISELASAAYEMRLSLGRELGIGGDARAKIFSQLNKQYLLGAQLGLQQEDIFESYTALYSEFKNFKVPADMTNLIVETAAIGKRFNLDIAQAAKITSGLVRFQGMDVNDINSMFNTLEGSAEAMGISTSDVGESMAMASEYMYKFNLGTKKGANDFNKMVLSSAKLGINLGKVLSKMDEFRDFKEAMGGAALAARWGINVSPQALMSMGMTGEGTGEFVTSILKRIQGAGTLKNGNLSGIGMQMADDLEALTGLGRGDVIQILKRAQENGWGLNEATQKYQDEIRKDMDIRKKFQQNINKILGGFINPTLELLYRALEPIGWAIDKIGDGFTYLSTKIGEQAVQQLTNIALGITAILLFLKAKGMLPGIGSAIGRAFGGDEYGGGHGGGRGKRGVPKGKGIPGGFGLPSPGQMLAGAAGMIAMAGAFWILSKAVQNFVGIEWKTLVVASAALVGFTAVITGMGAILAGPIGMAFLSGSLAITILGAALIPFSMAMNNFASASNIFGTGLINIGEGLKSLGELSVFSTLKGVGVAVGAMTEIGKVAEKYAEPVNKMASALAPLVGIGAIGSIGRGGGLSKKEYEVVPLEIPVTINLDGKKIARVVSYYGIEGKS